MTKQKSTLLLAAALAAGMAATADAQQHQPGGGRWQRQPAARPAAPTLPHPHRAWQRRRCQRRGNVSTAHVGTAHGHAAMRHVWRNRVSQPRMATPHIYRATDGNATHSASPTVNRTVQRQQFRQERELASNVHSSTARTPSAQARLQRAGADETANAGTAADEFTVKQLQPTREQHTRRARLASIRSARIAPASCIATRGAARADPAGA